MRARAIIAKHPELWLVLFLLAVLAPFMQQLTAQGASRYALTAAIWDKHTVDVGAYPLGIDRAVLPDGRLRSDKAPGQPLLAVPVYAVARAVGAEPGTHERLDQNLGVWWVTLWSTVLPLCLLCVLMRRIALELGAAAPTIAAIVIALGTTTTDVATQLFAHVLTALFVFAAWFVVRGAKPEQRTPWIIGGFLVGCAVATELPTFLIGVVLTGYVLWRARSRLGWFILGGLPPAALLATYNAIAFGRPWSTGYSKHADAGGFFGLKPPHLRVLLRIFFDSKGLLFLTPIVVLALIMAIMQSRRSGPARVDAVVALACFGAMLLMQSGWPNPWGGEYAGPRYMIVALPFLATPLAVGWSRFRAAAIVLSAWSIGVMSLSYVTSGLVGQNSSAITTWLHRVRDHVFTPTTWTMLFGDAGAFVHIALIAATGACLVIATTQSGAPPAGADAESSPRSRIPVPGR